MTVKIINNGKENQKGQKKVKYWCLQDIIDLCKKISVIRQSLRVFLPSFPWCTANSLNPSYKSQRIQRSDWVRVWVEELLARNACRYTGFDSRWRCFLFLCIVFFFFLSNRCFFNTIFLFAVFFFILTADLADHALGLRYILSLKPFIGFGDLITENYSCMLSTVLKCGKATRFSTHRLSQIPVIYLPFSTLQLSGL